MLRHFIIQRDDGTWYAGRAEAGAELWVIEPPRGLRFRNYGEARETEIRLQEAGHVVRLYLTEEFPRR
jgi:hypothetical protein